jgi:hypothetical protein
LAVILPEMTEIDIIVKIGIEEKCNNQDLAILLPNLPTIRGNEFLINKTKIIEDGKNNNLKQIIKGLHFAEITYGKLNNYFGFGSTSQTLNLLNLLAETEYDEAVEIEKWIALNRGNYFIKSLNEKTSFISRIQTKLMIKNSNKTRAELIDLYRKNKKELRQIKSEKKNLIQKEKANIINVERKKLFNLTIAELIEFIKKSDKPIYYFKAVIEFRIEEIRKKNTVYIKFLESIEPKTNKTNPAMKKILRLIK